MLETDRLLLEKFSVEDAVFMLELLNTPSWLMFIGDRNVHTLDEAQQYILNGALRSYETNGYGPYVVKLKTNKIPIGICGLFKREFLNDPDIGFAFLPDYSGNGYGYESAAAVMTYDRTNIGAKRITGITDATNVKSIRLLEKLGMRFEKEIDFKADGTKSLLFGVTTA